MNTKDTSFKGTMSFIALDKIVIIHNPREHFDEKALQDLADDIKLHGVLQSILVRPIADTDTFELVCGGRRVRASRMALGENGVIPAFIRPMTDEEAIAAAASENESREDVSETEQANGAIRLLEMCKGDRAETARRLGWSITKLDRRLALGKLNDPCRKALNERRILVGHAELLATVSPDKQDSALEKILERNLTVSQTKEIVTRMSCQLDAAIFDKTECSTCQFNSTLQRSLFGTTINDGACTNAPCYALKTEQAQAAKDALEKEAAAAAAAAAPATEPGENSNAEQIAAQGGEESSLPVAASGESQTSPSNETAQTTAAAPASNDATDATNPVAKTLAKVTAKTDADSKKSDNDSSTRNAMISKTKELREKIWRRSLARQLSQRYEQAMDTVIFAAFTGTIHQISSRTMSARAGLMLGDDFAKARTPETQIATLVDYPEDKKILAFQAISAGYAMDAQNFTNIIALCKKYGVDVRALFAVDRNFLEIYTKSELRLLALESGFIDAYGAKKFAKVLTGKREELIKVLLESKEFSWTNHVPCSISLSGKHEQPLRGPSARSPEALPADQAPATAPDEADAGRDTAEKIGTKAA